MRLKALYMKQCTAWFHNAIRSSLCPSIFLMLWLQEVPSVYSQGGKAVCWPGDECQAGESSIYFVRFYNKIWLHTWPGYEYQVGESCFVCNSVFCLCWVFFTLKSDSVPDLVMSAKQVSPVLPGNPVFCLFCVFFTLQSGSIPELVMATLCFCLTSWQL